MARKGILTTEIDRTTPARRTPRSTQSAAVGALQSSLSKMQQNTVQDIDAGLIDMAGVEDRLGHDPAAHKALMDSLRTYSQQVPVLVRPHPKHAQRFEIVYGRRRLQALRELGLPVKAMVRQLDDEALVLAQGQENTARQDLSFVEKASFAAQLDAAGYDRKTIADALSIDLPMLSRMLKVGQAFSLDLLKRIGSAPGIGRERWLALVKALDATGARSRVEAVTKRPEFAGLPSDDRFEAALAAARKQPQAKPVSTPDRRPLRAGDGATLGDIKRGAKAVTLTLRDTTPEGFGHWVDTHADALLQELYDRWQKADDRRKSNNQEAQD